jgi:hypothetical protein
MAKNRVGVLEAHEAVDSTVPQVHCGRAIAERLVADRKARRLGKRLIQMISGAAQEAVQQAKAARDWAIAAQIAALQRLATIRAWFDGPIGTGNLIPFGDRRSTPLIPPSKMHYEMPRAGDRGLRRHNLYRRRDRHGKLCLDSKQIHVSSRSLFSQQTIPAVRLAV